MREFFKGWRRKVGCALLVLACALMAGWFRGHLIGGAFRWRVTNEALMEVKLREQDLHFCYSWLAHEHHMRYDGFIFQWDDSTEKSAEYLFGTLSASDGRDGYFVNIHYLPWALIFVAVSTYLILWKPRKRSAKMDGA